MAAAFVVLVPRVIAPGLRMMQPISRMKQSQTQLEQLEAQSNWKRPAAETLTAEQLDRFFAVRQRIDTSRRGADPRLDRLPRKHVRSLEELRQVPDIIRGVGEAVTGELDAYVAGRMTPEEYHWVSRIVYGHWRDSLRRAGRYPAALRAAAAEVEISAAQEPDRRVRARLEGLAAEMRRRTPDPPEGFDPATHQLLLGRLDDVERWSLDDTESRLPR
jgi:hypothetical protein